MARNYWRRLLSCGLLAPELFRVAKPRQCLTWLDRTMKNEFERQFMLEDINLTVERLLRAPRGSNLSFREICITLCSLCFLFPQKTRRQISQMQTAGQTPVESLLRDTHQHPWLSRTSHSFQFNISAAQVAFDLC